MKKSFIAVAAITAAFSLASQAAAAPPFMCDGTFSGATYQDVIVPAAKTCTLSGTRVTGNVTVQKGGSFFVNATSTDTTIAGNVTGDLCVNIKLESSSDMAGRIVVGGNLTITNCTGGGFDGGDGSAFSTNTPPPTLVIGGSVKCDNNAGSGCGFDFASIGGNFECSGNLECLLGPITIGGNATLTGNGHTEIFDGNIGGSVNCSGNSSLDPSISSVDLDRDAIGKNVTLIDNGVDNQTVTNSVIGGNIECGGNTGGVSDPTPNTIAGTKSGQCSAF